MTNPLQQKVDAIREEFQDQRPDVVMVLDELSKKAEQMEWQPIETAPKHTEILVWHEHSGTLLGIHTHLADWMIDPDVDDCSEFTEEELFHEEWFYSNGHGFTRAAEDNQIPTQWRPLDQPPKAGE